MHSDQLDRHEYMPRQQSHFSMVTWNLMWLTLPRQPYLPSLGWAYLARMVGSFGPIGGFWPMVFQGILAHFNLENRACFPQRGPI